VDLTELRDVFDRLEHRITSGVSGKQLRERFQSHPLQVLKEQGIDVAPLSAAPDLWQTLHDRLSKRQIDPPKAESKPDVAPKDEKEARKRAPSADSEAAKAEELPETEGGFSCWACHGSAAVAVCLAAVSVADHLRAPDSETQQSLAELAPALAPILGVSTAAAAHEAVLALAGSTDLSGFVARLVDRACAHTC
jgi:hypothetical protein